MAEFTITIKGLEELKAAIRRSPETVLDQTRLFLQRGVAAYMRTIISNPWRIGAAGGGAPVKTGLLKEWHRQEFRPFEARITPYSSYASYVHEGTKHMEKRPWLDYAKSANESEIIELSRDLLAAVTKDLAL